MKRGLILIAEDDVDDRFLLETAFTQIGCSEILHFVENGAEVLSYLKAASQLDSGSQYPEIIILDLNMPKKNGKEVLSEIKQHPVYKNTPVIVYTTTNNPAEVKHCYELGANTYIVKPIDFDSLIKVVDHISNYWLTIASIPALN